MSNVENKFEDARTFAGDRAQARSTTTETPQNEPTLELCKVASTSRSYIEPVYNDLAKEVAALRKEVQALTLMHRRSRPRSRSKRDTRKNRSSSRSQSSYRKFPLCWYHSKFGEKADKCVRPCDYRSENSKGNR
ncbi:unnamed protein product [Parnassius mnemosyne]|uniref:Uncharacterized protein n=1 Tax=Parnassius mnemosyne TaxID=213953 RepID=A0AAV1M9I6_9NEOP